MDQNGKKPGENFPKLKPAQKIEQLRGFRDKQNYSQDWFINAIIDENLVPFYLMGISKNNLY